MRGQRHCRTGRVSLQGQIYHVIISTSGRWPYFADLRLARAVVEAIRFEHEQRSIESLTFVVMPDHVHWLFSLNGERPLSQVVQRLKSRSARRVNALRKASGRIWKPGFYDRAIRREENVVGVARYIIANPIRGGLVQRVGDYPHWDSVWCRERRDWL